MYRGHRDRENWMWHVTESLPTSWGKQEQDRQLIAQDKNAGRNQKKTPGSSHPLISTDFSVLHCPSPAVDHVIPEPGSSLMEAYDLWRQWADEKACCDYSLHVDITHWNDSIKQEVDALIREKGWSCDAAPTRQVVGCGSAWRCFRVTLCSNISSLCSSAAGVNSFQVYMAYKDYYQMSNSEVKLL